MKNNMTGFKRTVLLFTIVYILGLNTGRAFSQSVDKKSLDYQQVTTHPDIDLSARISPDGKWMTYVSRQSGNFDIWIRSTAGGRDIQITTHKADDYYPVWSPNGKSIVFVSQRSDAAGDIWRVHLREVKGKLYPKDKLERLTDYLGLDGYPTVSPDGKKVCWVSDRTGREELWFHNDNTGKTNQLTFLGGTHPVWSPDLRFIAFTSFRDGEGNNGDIFVINLKGPKPTGSDTLLWDTKESPTWQITKGPEIDGFPSWNPNARQITFLRYQFDTNADLRISPADRAIVWEAEVFESPVDSAQTNNPMLERLEDTFNLRMVSYAMPLTSGGENAMQPWSGANNRIYFTSDRGGNLDIWSFKETGYIAKMNTPQEQFDLAENTYALPLRMTRQILGPLFLDWDLATLVNKEQLTVWDRTLAYRRVIDFHGTANPLAAQSFYEMGVCYDLLGFPQEAKKYLQLVLDNYPQERTITAYTEMVLLGIKAQQNRHADNLEMLLSGLEAINQKYKDQAEPAAAARIVMGDLLYKANQDARAFREYQKVLQEFPQQHSQCAESQLKIGDVFKRFASQEEVINAYLQVVINYPEQRQWMVPARDRILDLLTVNVNRETQLVGRYREITGQYAQFPLLAAAAQQRIGDILYRAGDNASAIQEYDLIPSLFPDLEDEVFTAQMCKADALLKMGEKLQAFTLLEQLEEKFKTSREGLSRLAWQKLLDALLESGVELKQMQEFNLALLRFARAKEMSPSNQEAHRGYIECMYYLLKIDQAVVEYESLVKQYPNEQIILYSLGLVYSYKGTEKAELYDEPDALDQGILNRSSYTIARSLAMDYTLVQPYLTISYNYEMMEQAQQRERAKPKKFFTRAWEMIQAPFLSLYNTLTFAKLDAPRGYYERAIHELTKAIGLNDEQQDPKLEANLALNLANNYYNLGEFGFENAYKYYHIKMALDSTFFDEQREALIFERMGHCALVVEDLQQGPRYLKRAIRLYTEQGSEGHVLLNTSRLALLYQVGEVNEFAIEYFQIAAEIQKRRNMYDELMRSYRSIAYNYLMLDEPGDAIYYAQLAMDLLESGQVREIKNEASRVKLGILGLYMPLPFLDLSKMASGAALKLTTNDERALVFSILGNSYARDKNYNEAISYLQKKMELYKKRKDYEANATFLNNIGFLYFLKGDYTNSWDYFLQSFEISKKRDIKRGVIINSTNLAKIVLALNAGVQVGQMDNNLVGKDLQQYHQIAAEKINIALEVTREEEARYAQLICNQYRYLADFSLVSFYNRQSRDLATNIHATLDFIDNASYTKTYLEEALRISQEYELSYEECSINYELGRLYKKLQNTDESFNYLNSSRKLAIRNAYYDLLWRIDTDLGDLLSTMDLFVKRKHAIQWDAYEFFNEAIEVMQSYPEQTDGANAAMKRLERQTPYRRAIDYLVQEGDSLEALAFTERLRASLYLDIVRGENIELRKERHKIYYGNAKYLQNQINELQITLLKYKNQFNIPYSQILETRAELEDYKQEYQRLLDNAREEVPELETLVRVNPVQVSQVQQRLRDKEAILYIESQDDRALVWLITGNRIEFNTVPVSSHELSRQIIQLNSDIKTGKNNRQAVEALSSLVMPVQAIQEQLTRLVIIPSLDAMLAPWSILLEEITAGGQPLPFVVCSSLSDYYFSVDKRKILGQRVYFASIQQAQNPLKDYGYTVALPLASAQPNSFTEQIQPMTMSDLIYMSVTSEWNEIDPARSRMGFRIKQSSPAVFTSIDLYKMSLNAGLVYIGFENAIPFNKFNEPFIAWERAFRYAGAPSMLVTLWETTPQENNEFLSLFYQNVQTMPVADALIATQMSFKEQGKPQSFWARFQLYGFGGMTNEEESRYAVEGFEVQVRRGHSAFDLGEWADAIRFYESASQMAERKGDEQSIRLLQQRILETAVNGGLWDKAIEKQLAQIDKAQKQNNVSGIAAGYNNLAFFYTQKGDYEKGIAAKARFLELAERYGLKEEEAKSLRETGLIYERGGKYATAIEFFTQAKEKFQQINKPAGVAQCLRDIGRINFVYYDNYYDAMQVQQQALDIFRALGPSPDLVDALHNLGITAEKMANYQQALQYQQEALQISSAANSRKLIGLSKQYLANVYWKTGDFQNALSNQNQALEIFQELNDEKLLQVGYATRGLIALSLGQAQPAMEFELQALELASARNDKSDQATIYKNIGMIQRTMGRDDLALSSFEQAAAIDSTIGSRRGLAYDFRNIASIYIARKELAQAKHYCNRSMHISQAIGDQRNQAQCQLEFGRLHLLNKQADSARVYFTRAAEAANRLFIADIEWRAYKNLAETDTLQKNITAAIENYYRALDVIEKMRARIKVEEYASGFVDDKMEVYGALISLLFDNNQGGNALMLVERAKSRSFLDLLGNKKIDFKQAGDKVKSDSLLAHMQALQSKLYYLRTSSDSVQIRQTGALEAEMDSLKSVYSVHLLKLQETNPQLSDMMTVNPWPVEKIQTTLPDSVALLEFYFYKNYLYSWFVQWDHFIFKKTIVNEQQVIQNVFELRQALEKQLSITKWSQELYNVLLAPWESELAGVKNLVIIPQGQLHYLPFAVLQNGMGDFFGLKHAHSFAPSATVYGFCMARGDSLLSRNRRSMPLLAFGNPDLGDKSWSLPFASLEVNAMTRYYPTVNAFFEKRASETNFLDQNNYPPLLLFSCHGQYDDANPMLSALLLAPDSSNDGRLEAHEIFSLDLDAFVVAMSACETGLGAIRGGDEVIGLSRSFIYAGTASLLSSLWKVDDLATAVLIKRFFRYLAEGKSRAEALQLAQKVVYTEINPYPAFWGAFTITGDFR